MGGQELSCSFRFGFKESVLSLYISIAPGIVTCIDQSSDKVT